MPSRRLRHAAIGIFVGDPADPELGGSSTAADFALRSAGGGRALPALARCPRRDWDDPVNDSCSPTTASSLREEGLREALTSTGNGYFCTRGCAEWEDADGIHYPGTYAHGGYNRETRPSWAASPVLNEDLVNLPNWLVLKLRIEGEEPIHLGERRAAVLSPRRYDFRNGRSSTRELRFRDRAGRETSLRSRRFVSMRTDAPGGARVDLTPENWSGRSRSSRRSTAVS